MTSFIKYLFHRIRSTWILTAVLAFAAIVIVVATVDAYPTSYYEPIYDELGISVKEEVMVEGFRFRGLGYPYLILCILCTAVPVLELRKLKNKRNADTIYSLPIDRRKLGAAHFTNGFLQILAVYIPSVIAASLIAFIRSLRYVDRLDINLCSLIPLYLIPIPLAFCLYAYFCFLFNEANRTSDGCVFIISGILAPFAIGTALQSFDVYRNGEFAHLLLHKMKAEQMFPYFPFTKIFEIFESRVVKQERLYGFEKYDGAMFAIWCAIGLLAAVGFYLAFSRKRVEKIGDISSSPVGYKVFIPIAMFCITAYMGTSGEFILVTTGFIASIIGYMLYRRSFRVKPRDVISIVSAIALAVICRTIEGMFMVGGGTNL